MAGMNVFTLEALLKLNDSEFTKSLSSAEGKMSGFGEKLGNIGNGIKKIGAAAGAFAVAGAVATGKIVKGAVDAYASYEQLTGGVETLFGTSAKSLEGYRQQIGLTDKASKKELEQSFKDFKMRTEAEAIVMENAHNAYKNAGMSANEYMETVTGFSASLLQGLKGDTVKAAQISDMAMIDMADNANKMGTDMSSIQHAYQGFAKQNYTMLDNLKLGYGGTRTEMQRLLKDAGKLTGKKYNLNNLADVYEAIHVIQEEMGITGTTAEEAATTIEGSTRMMKASWENLKVALVSKDGNIGQAISEFSSSVKTAVVDNWIPAIKKGLEGFGTMISELAPIISAELPGLVNAILPGLSTAVVSVVKAVASVLADPQTIQTVVDVIGQIIPVLIETIATIVPELVKAVPQMLQAIATAVLTNLPAIWEGVKSAAKGILVFVFGEDENGGIKWPTAEELWAKIESGLKTLWAAIQPLAEDILKLIFGEDEDGGIKWPTAEQFWAKIKSGLETIWHTIQTFAKGILKFVFGEDENGGIKWPTADEIWTKIKAGLDFLWSGIKTLAKTVLTFVFGEDENGGIKWPTSEELWTKIKEGLDTLWSGIKTFAGEILKLVFGEGEDGGIKWPTAEELWAKIESGLTTLWDGIKNFAKNILKLIFGEDADGGIKWPTAEQLWAKIKSGLETVWKTIQTFAKGILKLVFGTDKDGGIKWPTAAEIWAKIKEGLSTLWEGIKNLAKTILTFVFGEDADGGIKWPTAEEVWAKIKEGLQTLWNGIKEFAKSILKFMFGSDADGGIQFPTASELWEKIKEGFTTLWNGIKSLIADVAKWALGELILPTIESVRQKITTWWEDVKKGLALTYTATVKVIEQKLTSNPSTGEAPQSQEEYVGNVISNGVDMISEGLNNPLGYALDLFGSLLSGNAKGNWDVPYDNFPALLHRNEMVLTASQARRLRDGAGSGAGIGAIAGIVGQEVRKALSGIGIYMGSDRVADLTADRMNDNIGSWNEAILHGMGGA